nr:MAG TPA: hypothetical protein [Caudoviricetes sp.]
MPLPLLFEKVAQRQHYTLFKTLFFCLQSVQISKKSSNYRIKCVSCKMHHIKEDKKEDKRQDNSKESSSFSYACMRVRDFMYYSLY